MGFCMHKLYTQMKIYRHLGTKKEIKLITIKQKKNKYKPNNYLPGRLWQEKVEASWHQKETWREVAMTSDKKEAILLIREVFSFYDLIANSDCNKIEF